MANYVYINELFDLLSFIIMCTFFKNYIRCTHQKHYNITLLNYVVMYNIHTIYMHPNSV